MRVLVTGGSGFIGSHVVDRLTAHGHQPRIFDRVPSPWHADGEVPLTLGDVTDVPALEGAMAGCEAVIHLAAVADVNRVHAAPDAAETVNVRGTLAVLEAARGCRVARVVYGSTIWVYSDCREPAVDEDTPLGTPAHFYTATKLAGELYLRAYADLYGIEYTILRFGIPYGPRARPAAVVPAFVERALAGEPITIAGDGGQGRRFVYVEDLAEGVARALRPAAANRVYNLAGRETVSVRQIAETVREQVGEVEIVHGPGRPSDFAGREVSSARAERELGWLAETPFAEGLRRYLAWRQARRAVPAGPPAPVASPRPDRVLIVSADIGEGHDLPARALARELAQEATDVDVEIRDGLRAMGRLVSRTVREGSWLMFRRARWLFELQYWLMARFAPTRWLARRLSYLVGARRLRRLVRESRADAVISTYPGTTEILGELRRRRKLAVPVYSAITDLAGLWYWAHPGVDLHFVTHPESIEEVERIAGPGRARWSRPPTDPEFERPRDRAAARRALGLPEAATVVAVSGGGWGMGDLAGAIEAALSLEDGATVVALTGRNPEARRRLAERFAGDARVRVLGFTERMGDVLAAADALVHSTAGLTVLEAIMRGCPVVSYGFGIGHVRVNNAAFARFGLAGTARDPTELVSALRRAVAARPKPDLSFARRPPTASWVLAGPPLRPAPGRVRRLRPVLGRAAAATSAMLLFLSSDVPYSVLGGPLHVRPVTRVSTGHDEVGMLIDAPGRAVSSLARALAARDVRASFVAEASTPAATPATLRRLGDEAVPRMGGGFPTRWLGTRGALHRQARRLGLPRHYLVAVPADGFTLGQYMLARSAGASPVEGAVRIRRGAVSGALRPGVVVQASARGPAAAASLAAALADAGVAGVPVGELLRHQR